MARSILPSTYRREQREKARVKRAARRGLRQALHHLEQNPAEWDDDDCVTADDTQLEIQALVSWRRDKDKLNHFERWAVKLTANLPVESRLSAMRRVLPSNLIGQHALSHLKHRNEFMSAEAIARRNAWRYRRLTPTTFDRGLLAEVLREMARDGEAHRALNRGLDAEATRLELQPVPTRKLAGLHDVLPFLDSLRTSPLFRFVNQVAIQFTAARGALPRRFRREG